jgi:hypothetical protein
MTQQDNCICRVTLENQIKPISIGLRKYDGLAASVPMQYGCGLAVDINHIPDMSTGNVIAPIKLYYEHLLVCLDTTSYTITNWRVSLSIICHE